MLRKKSRTVDMTRGALLSNILLFSLPLMFSSVLQLLFNAADVVVVGRYEGAQALAAVGSTTSLIQLIVQFFLGLSAGVNVIVARDIGAGKIKEVSRSSHTGIAISLVGGAFLTVVGVIFSETFLRWMGSPDDVRPLATIYMRIFFLGMPVNMLYNFGAAILRGIGDTKRPLVFLTIAGIANVIMNLFFVIVLHMGVAGVALATILSQGISALLVLSSLIHIINPVRITLNKLRIDPEKGREMLKYGLPAGLQSMCFSISNVLIQSTINSFGSIVVAGNSITSNLEGFIYASMNSLYQAALTFTSQNVGAKLYGRVRKICVTSVLVCVGIGVFLSAVVLIFGDFLMGIYSDVPEVIAVGRARMGITTGFQFLCGIMDVLCGVLRGLGATIMPMIVSLLGACAFRILWILLILPFSWTLMTLYISYPISWLLTGLVHLICLIICLRKLPKGEEPDASAH